MVDWGKEGAMLFFISKKYISVCSKYESFVGLGPATRVLPDTHVLLYNLSFPAEHPNPMGDSRATHG